MRNCVMMGIATLALGGCVTMPPPIVQSNLEIQAYQTANSK